MKTLKNSKIFLIAVLLSVGLVGCTIKGGEVVDEDKNKEVTCTDTRDGETFNFNTNNITNFRQGIGADHSIDVVDNEGKKRHITSSMEVWLKCEKAE